MFSPILFFKFVQDSYPLSFSLRFYRTFHRRSQGSICSVFISFSLRLLSLFFFVPYCFASLIILTCCVLFVCIVVVFCFLFSCCLCLPVYVSLNLSNLSLCPPVSVSFSLSGLYLSLHRWVLFGGSSLSLHQFAILLMYLLSNCSPLICPPLSVLPLLFLFCALVLCFFRTILSLYQVSMSNCIAGCYSEATACFYTCLPALCPFLVHVLSLSFCASLWRTFDLNRCQGSPQQTCTQYYSWCRDKLLPPNSTQRCSET